jgi:hypothetical protein
LRIEFSQTPYGDLVQQSFAFGAQRQDYRPTIASIPLGRKQFFFGELRNSPGRDMMLRQKAF